MATQASNQSQPTSMSPLDYPPKRPKPDVEGLVAIFPLINTTHPAAAMGVLILYTYELNALQNVPGVTISTADDIHFDNAAFWVDEISIHTMSTDDLNAYHRFIYNPNDPKHDYWQEIVTQHLAPEHEKAFREEGLYLRTWEDRKFKRVPVEHMTNLNKTALYEFQGVERTPDHMLPSPRQKKKEKYPIPAWAGAMRKPGVDRGDDSEDLKYFGTRAASVKKEYAEGFGYPLERHGGGERRREYLRDEEQLTDKKFEEQLLRKKDVATDELLKSLTFLGTGSTNPSSTGLSHREHGPLVASAEDSGSPPRDAASGLPLMEEIAERTLLMTVQEAEQAEEAWVEHGEEWHRKV
ncbi:hypothetical protein B0A55_01817 [Friedmanniomyces simplex]|uniref:Uncharacterized protein n=1 Tax=Friedmanniomyces simplex TaxID=329884 RepID=A0A4U0Y071_9PEZI|nr:hypothetical protein B0A55_01817 [Friedmanniomyces simplex]